MLQIISIEPMKVAKCYRAPRLETTVVRLQNWLCFWIHYLHCPQNRFRSYEIFLHQNWKFDRKKDIMSRKEKNEPFGGTGKHCKPRSRVELVNESERSLPLCSYCSLGIELFIYWRQADYTHKIMHFFNLCETLTWTPSTITFFLK